MIALRGHVTGIARPPVQVRPMPSAARLKRTLRRAQEPVEVKSATLRFVQLRRGR